MYAIAAGYEDVNDHDHLCKDQGFQISVKHYHGYCRDYCFLQWTQWTRRNGFSKKSVIELEEIAVLDKDRGLWLWKEMLAECV